VQLQARCSKVGHGASEAAPSVKRQPASPAQRATHEIPANEHQAAGEQADAGRDRGRHPAPVKSDSPRLEAMEPTVMLLTLLRP
jgi:hypothetical protein